MSEPTPELAALKRIEEKLDRLLIAPRQDANALYMDELVASCEAAGDPGWINVSGRLYNFPKSFTWGRDMFMPRDDTKIRAHFAQHRTDKPRDPTTDEIIAALRRVQTYTVWGKRKPDSELAA